MKIEKYVDAFCFSHYFISDSGKNLFYCWQKEGEKKLYHASTSLLSLTEGELVLDKDFSNCSMSIRHFDEERQWLYLIMDEENKENFNLWRLDLHSKELRQITHLKMTYGLTFQADHLRCWCYNKEKLADGTFKSDVYEVDLLSLQTTWLFSDEGRDDRIGWTPMAKIPGSDEFVFTVDFLNQRKKTNVVLYSLSKKEWKKLLPETLEVEGNPSLIEENPGMGGFLFESVHEGFQNIYFYSFSAATFRKITDLDQKNENITIISKGDHKDIYILLKTASGFKLNLYDEFKKQKEIKLSSLLYVFETAHEHWAILSHADATNKIVKFDLDGTLLKTIETTAISSAELEHTQSQWVSYKSFDDKEIKALLHLPKGELRAVSIMAFYGGEEHYSRHVQRYAEMGIAVLSPAVRGSWGWGREWEKMLEGDLGGHEILDIIWGAKFLQQKLQLPAGKIGVHGGSHGGFATLRAITMPSVFNGIENTSFPFGFAVSQVGFADLVAFYKDSRIADWLVHLLGPFDEEKYLARSPLTHFENLKTPLLLINGKNDSRVPFSTIEKFIEKLKDSDKVYELLVHEKEGHGTSNRKTTLLELELESKFLAKYIC